jgi:FkbM family methyltransferase
MSPAVKGVMRSLVVPVVRSYFRYTPPMFPKKALWSVPATHFFGLEPGSWNFTTRTAFGGSISAQMRDTVGRYIYYFGVWEPNLTNWIEGRLRPGDVFIDVGANIGYHTVLASRLVGASGKVVAIEALPAIFATLQENITINGANNVRAVNCAVWDSRDLITFYSEPGELAVTTTAVRAWAKQWKLQKEYQVAAEPLSTILEPHEFETARLIKIDVEGAEWHVLSGMKPLMASARDDVEFVVEVTPKMLETEGRTGKDVFDFFARWGFHPYRLASSAADYFSRTPSRPFRIENPPADQADLIFSRADTESL